MVIMISRVIDCFARKSIHLMFICHSLSLKKGVRMKNNDCTCGSTTFSGRNFTPNISKIYNKNIEITEVLQFYVL